MPENWGFVACTSNTIAALILDLLELSFYCLKFNIWICVFRHCFYVFFLCSNKNCIIPNILDYPPLHPRPSSRVSKFDCAEWKGIQNVQIKYWVGTMKARSAPFYCNCPPGLQDWFVFRGLGLHNELLLVKLIFSFFQYSSLLLELKINVVIETWQVGSFQLSHQTGCLTRACESK